MGRFDYSNNGKTTTVFECVFVSIYVKRDWLIKLAEYSIFLDSWHYL